MKAILTAERKIGEGDPQGAIEILKKLSPDENDLIVRTMLANAYMDKGDFWSYKEFPEIEGKVDPKTPYEHLFVGNTVVKQRRCPFRQLIIERARTLIQSTR